MIDLPIPGQADLGHGRVRAISSRHKMRKYSIEDHLASWSRTLHQCCVRATYSEAPERTSVTWKCDMLNHHGPLLATVLDLTYGREMEGREQRFLKKDAVGNSLYFLSHNFLV